MSAAESGPQRATRVPRPRVKDNRPLAERELQTLQLIARGKTNAEIGRALFLSEDTVKTYNRGLFAKLGARDRAHAVAIGYQRRWLHVETCPTCGAPR